MLQGENGVVVVDVCATQLYGSAGQPANLARHPPMWWYSSDMKLWQNFIISASLRPLGSKSDPPYFWHSKAGSRIGRTSAFTSAVFLRSVKHRPAAAACLATAHGQRRQSVLEALLKAAGTGVEWSWLGERQLVQPIAHLPPSGAEEWCSPTSPSPPSCRSPQELDDAQVHPIPEAEAALVGADGGAELHAEAPVDLQLAPVVQPWHLHGSAQRSAQRMQ